MNHFFQKELRPDLRFKLTMPCSKFCIILSDGLVCDKSGFNKFKAILKTIISSKTMPENYGQ